VFLAGSKLLVRRALDGEDSIGIADPFLKMGDIKKSDKFWMFLHPGTITSLRHEWIHPEIDKEQKFSSESEQWLMEFASKWNMRYDEMLAGAQEEGGYTVARDLDLHSAGELDPGDEQLFWHHAEIVLGQKFSDEHKREFQWSCSC